MESKLYEKCLSADKYVGFSYNHLKAGFSYDNQSYYAHDYL